MYSTVSCNLMVQERRLEWFLSIGVEIKRKASIVFDDGAKISKILVKTWKIFSRIFPELVL